ncbi:dihydroneopterin aldolase [Maribius pontilimi]|uniref:Dihydroneopterin aldolase n=1 Tax=Palleronia pontilimi TaxID=1964209 RepID=A0A934I8S9_9RHOB|nr:dihydroneopterin aldolase [Palleronia pontilimi]MBJ3762564.1 dihydroneopterin aldolase [Palleronia pontilimi]
MPLRSAIELKDLQITTRIGTYGVHDVVPTAHILDLVLTIDPALVLIGTDGMDRVFDYDPLIKDIDGLARDGHYETQERLITRIVEACASYAQIEAVELMLCKTPVLGKTGRLGVRIAVDADALDKMRPRPASALDGTGW